MTTDHNATEEAKAAPQAPEKRSRKNKRSSKLFLLLAIVLLAGGAWLGYPMYQKAITHESTDDAFVEASVVPISPQVSGHMVRVLVEDNQQVRKGDLLAEVDPRDYEVALDIARARVQSAQAAHKEAEALVSAAMNGMAQKRAELSSHLTGREQAKAGVAEFVAGHDRDKEDLDRIQQIVDAGAVSRQEFDHARSQAAVSRAKLHSAQKQVETESAKITQARAALNAAEDALNQARAQVEIRAAELQEEQAALEQAQLDLSYTRITAPCDGYVTKKSVEPGAYVQVGQNLFSLVGSHVWVVANFKETQLEHMRAGLPVEIEIDAYPDVLFTGRVDSIQRGTGSRFTLLPPENASGNFIKVVQRVPVKITFEALDQTAHILAPGMSVIPSVNISGTGPAQLKAVAKASQATAAQ